MSEQALIQPFTTSDTDNIGLRWKKWVKKLERLFEIKNIEDDKKKITYLFFYGGDQLEDVYTEDAENDDTFDEICTKLSTRFNPTANNHLHVYNFRALHQFEDEPFDEFVQRLRDTAELCKFKDADA